MKIVQLKKSLGKLEDDPRHVIELRFMHRLSVKETAKRLGKTPENIRIIQFRALKQLKKYYEEK